MMKTKMRALKTHFKLMTPMNQCQTSWNCQSEIFDVIWCEWVTPHHTGPGHHMLEKTITWKQSIEYNIFTGILSRNFNNVFKGAGAEEHNITKL